MTKRFGLVLAGGLGRRMGRPKGSIELGGRSLAARAADVLSGLCLEVRISVRAGTDNPAPGFAALEDPPPAGRGPLAGIHAGFAVTGADELLVLACDYPNVNSEILDRLAEAGDASDVTLIAGADGRRHPLAACWRCTVLPELEAALGDGQFTVHRLLDRLRIRELGPSDFPGEDLGRRMLNVNDPADLKRLADEV